MIYYFSEMNHRGNHAGTKARNDAEEIMHRYGAKPINHKRLELSSNQKEEIKSNLRNRFSYIRYYLDILLLKGKTIVIQYPMLAFDIDYDYVKRLSKWNRVIFLVHDIQSLRNINELAFQKDMKMLKEAHGLIVHNRKMEEALRKYGVNAQRFYYLECFDYLYDGNIQEESEGLIFAGNLEKSIFLNTLIHECSEMIFKLYGPGIETVNKKSANISYGGSLKPDEIPGVISGKYGLVWDGDALEGGTGILGQYTKMNSPHKLSLYIAAGIPVIVWDGSASADLVRDEQIGVCVNTLKGLEKNLKNISEKDYETMKNNILILREKVINGDYLTNVLKQIELDCQKKK